MNRLDLLNIVDAEFGTDFANEKTPVIDLDDDRYQLADEYSFAADMPDEIGALVASVMQRDHMTVYRRAGFAFARLNDRQCVTENPDVYAEWCMDMCGWGDNR